MNETEITPEQKIVEATIDCIEKQGIQNVTIRSIAQEAGVNSAAISYYFRSKENLLDLALQTTVKNAFEDWEEIADRGDLDIRERLRLFLESILEGAVRWPGISRAHLYDPFVNGNTDALFLSRLNDFLDGLVSMFADTSFDSEEAIRLALLQLVSAVMLPGLIPGLFPSLSGGRVQEEKWQKEYVEHLLNRYF